MRKPSPGIAPEGFPAVGISAFAALVLALLDFCLPAVLFLVLTAFCLHFFRDPQRVVPSAPGLAVSPADGRVAAVTPRPDPFSGTERSCVSIFMNVFNVHVNRSPVEASVRAIAYHPGLFLNASLDKASRDNERCVYLLEDNDGALWSVAQIAGLIARRIVCRAEEGDRLLRGERLGMIKFGSRLDVYLPAGWSPAVAPGDRVLGGLSVLARKDPAA
ncbi:MAG: phosphatidylserine decarboxylase family protein [Desulfovibrio sp.]|jgi:phosphatidylserine decarboxylase|nr:phosphatidylserine decarboxylase family protein [Desulfovibrio sp.]